MTWFAAYLATGAFVGFLAGLLGIGGGMTLVPILAALFSAQHFAPDHIVHLSLGTAMASVVFTSTSSVREHIKLGSVDFAIVRRMAPGMVAGTLLSTLAAGWIAQRHLAMAFALIVCGGATQILLNKKPKPGRTLPGPAPLFAFGAVVGIISGLVSAGGAFLTMPFMLLCGVPVRTAIGTGATLGIPVAIIGTVGYFASGWNMPGLPSWSVGFVNLVALAGLVITSVVMAPYGARAAHRVPVLVLKRLFAGCLYLVAAKILFSFW
jgi:uncharacterized membrane protein YfcA